MFFWKCKHSTTHLNDFWWYANLFDAVYYKFERVTHGNFVSLKPWKRYRKKSVSVCTVTVNKPLRARQISWKKENGTLPQALLKNFRCTMCNLTTTQMTAIYIITLLRLFVFRNLHCQRITATSKLHLGCRTLLTLHPSPSSHHLANTAVAGSHRFLHPIYLYS